MGCQFFRAGRENGQLQRTQVDACTLAGACGAGVCLVTDEQRVLATGEVDVHLGQ